MGSTRPNSATPSGKTIRLRLSVWLCAFFILGGGAATAGQTQRVSHSRLEETTKLATRERLIAVTFAPVFHQTLGDQPRSDYLTNFDFDGDWRGDNNWAHATDPKFPMRAYAYYSVAETATHLFIVYAVFHARDYKGGDVTGPMLSDLMRAGAQRAGKYDPTGLAAETTFAHENDLEGCLVVVQKQNADATNGRVVFVETLRHGTFPKYVATESARNGFEAVSLDGQRPVLYIERKGHGIAAVAADKKDARITTVTYRFGGRADDPEQRGEGAVGYELIPIATTLWAHARKADGQTYGETHNYGAIELSVQTEGRVVKRKVTIGVIGSAFLGKVGGKNMARPPWGWFAVDRRDQPLGQWFFDPAATIKKDFQLGESFSTTYMRLPFWGGVR